MLSQILVHGIRPCFSYRVGDVQKQTFLLALVVRVHHTSPHETVANEVAVVVLLYVGCLQVDGVETADEAVVKDGHP